MFSFSHQRYRPADEMANLLRYISALGLILFFVVSLYGSATSFQTYADLLAAALGLIVMHSNIRVHQTSLGYGDSYSTNSLPLPPITPESMNSTAVAPIHKGMLRNGPPWSGGLGIWEQVVYAAFFGYMIVRTWTGAVGEW
jgi:hypothetical protein